MTFIYAIYEVASKYVTDRRQTACRTIRVMQTIKNILGIS